MNGIYQALVEDIKDPEKEGRVLARLVKDNALLEWASPCVPPASFGLPKEGDIVWIMFEEGDIDSPVWMGVFPDMDTIKEIDDSQEGGKFTVKG